jgi:hypothetical protein
MAVNRLHVGARRGLKSGCFVVPDDAEPNRSSCGAHDSDMREGGPQPVSEILSCTELGEFGRHDWRVRIMPDLVPQFCERIDIGCFSDSHNYCCHRAAAERSLLGIGYQGCNAHASWPSHPRRSIHFTVSRTGTTENARTPAVAQSAIERLYVPNGS